MPEVFVSLGSNQDRELNICSAVAALRQHYGDLRLSQVYQNKAVGFEGDDFLNMVAAFETDDPPQKVQEVFHQIESDHGRTRLEEKFSPRTLDLDLILYGDLVMNENGLRLPREDIEKYAFVLLPLSELSPNGEHPLTGKRYLEMWQDFTGDSELTAVDCGLSEVKT